MKMEYKKQEGGNLFKQIKTSKFKTYDRALSTQDIVFENVVFQEWIYAVHMRHQDFLQYNPGDNFKQSRI